MITEGHTGNKILYVCYLIKCIQVCLVVLWNYFLPFVSVSYTYVRYPPYGTLKLPFRSQLIHFINMFMLHYDISGAS